VAPEGERLAKVGFGDEFGLPSGAGVVFLASRELLTLPIGSFYVGSSVGSPAVYLGSDAQNWGHRWCTNFHPGPKISGCRYLGDVLGPPVKMLLGHLHPHAVNGCHVSDPIHGAYLSSPTMPHIRIALSTRPAFLAQIWATLRVRGQPARVRTCPPFLYLGPVASPPQPHSHPGVTKTASPRSHPMKVLFTSRVFEGIIPYLGIFLMGCLLGRV
jgi:hypothetical protein